MAGAGHSGASSEKLVQTTADPISFHSIFRRSMHEPCILSVGVDASTI